MVKKMYEELFPPKRNMHKMFHDHFRGNSIYLDVLLLALVNKLRHHIFPSLHFVITTIAIVFIFYISKCSLS